MVDVYVNLDGKDLAETHSRYSPLTASLYAFTGKKLAQIIDPLFAA